MEKIWFIHLNNKTEGPFTIIELKIDKRLTPDTLVWKEGFDGWKRIKEVEELKDLFEEEELTPSDELPLGSLPSDSEITLGIQKEPPFLLFWVIVLMLVFGYMTYLYVNNLN